MACIAHTGEAYSLDDSAEDDFNLTSMCLRDDRPGWNRKTDCGKDAKVLEVQAALALEPRLRLFLSPWSPPTWMKTSGEFSGGHLKGLGPSSADKRYVEAWARSYVKFVDLWQERNVTFWGLTVLNEPGGDQFISWNSMGLSGADEKELVEVLGPLIKAKHPSIKLMIHDDQVYALKSRLEGSGAGILDSPHVDGIAFHWQVPCY